MPAHAPSPPLLAGVAACAVLIASCAAPTEQATPPTSSSVVVSSPAVSSGPLITVPGLSSPAESTTESPDPDVRVADAEFRAGTRARTGAGDHPRTGTRPGPEPEPEPEPEQEPAPAPAPEPEPAPAPAPIAGGRSSSSTRGTTAPTARTRASSTRWWTPGSARPSPATPPAPRPTPATPSTSSPGRSRTTCGTFSSRNGITVVMTRDSDDGVGPCVNKRARRSATQANADLVLSIHGDGVDNDSDLGFLRDDGRSATRPARTMAAQSARSRASTIRDGLVQRGPLPVQLPRHERPVAARRPGRAEPLHPTRP